MTAITVQAFRGQDLPLERLGGPPLHTNAVMPVRLRHGGKGRLLGPMGSNDMPHEKSSLYRDQSLVLTIQYQVLFKTPFSLSTAMTLKVAVKSSLILDVNMTFQERHRRETDSF